MVSKRMNSRTTTRRPLFTTGIIALILVACLVGVYVFHSQNTKHTAKNNSSTKALNSVSYSPSSSQDNAANNARKASSNPQSTLDNGTSDNSITSSLSVKIVSASVNNGNLHIGTLVSGATSGNCTLTASSTGQQVTLGTATIKQDINDYDCGVFNIDTSQFPSSGTWQVTLTISSGGTQSSDSTQVTIPGS